MDVVKATVMITWMIVLSILLLLRLLMLVPVVIATRRHRGAWSSCVSWPLAHCSVASPVAELITCVLLLCVCLCVRVSTL